MEVIKYFSRRYAIVSFDEGEEEACEIVREDWLQKIGESNENETVEALPGCSGKWATHWPPKKLCSTRNVFTKTLQDPFMTSDSNGFTMIPLWRLWKRNIRSLKKADKMLVRAQRFDFRKEQPYADSSATCVEDEDVGNDDDEVEDLSNTVRMF